MKMTINENIFRPFLKELKEYVPGKSINDVAREHGLMPSDIIKLGSNENVLGPSPMAMESIKSLAGKANLYPSMHQKELRQKIANFIGLGYSSENIMVGAGMDGVLDTLARILIEPGNEVVIPIPTFTYYELACRYYGAEVLYVMRDANYEIDFNALIEAINPATKMVFICSPNNPTGNTLNQEHLRKFLTHIHHDFICFVDEAYYDFSTEGSVVDLVQDFPNLIVGRTFSKVYGLAGLRVGYAVANPAIVRQYYMAATPFAVNRLAEKAAETALDDSLFIMKSIMMVQKGRDYLKENILFPTYPSQANFILMNTAPLTASFVAGELLKKGIILRDCKSFPYLGETFIRITVGTAEQNQRIAEEINGIYSDALKR